MNLVVLNLCGVLLQPVLAPSPALEAIYRDSYGCNFESSSEGALNSTTVSPAKLYRFFPGKPTYWPVFDPYHIDQENYNFYINAGIKPGIILPDSLTKNISIKEYRKIRGAIKDGAIVIVQGTTFNSKELYASATFASAIGLRPQLFLKNNHFDSSFNDFDSGSYIFNNEVYTHHLPVPNGIHKVNNKHVIPMSTYKTYGHGMQVIRNPTFDPLIVENIEYPPLGVEWKFAGSRFVSTPESLETSLVGHAWALFTMIAIPIGAYLTGELPSLFPVAANLASSFSVLFGLLLIIIFVFAIFRNRRS
ncbi:MAG: hypothetical protein Q8L72_01880 [Moraxellaceae bacterium]|nr:hypothetical protein [Moraxellaceae bacterium]